MPRSTASDDEYEPSPGRRGGGGDVIQNMPYDEALELSQESEASSLADGKPSPAVHKSNCRGASSPLLNHDLHAIDATPARWRGVVVFSARFSLSTRLTG